MTDWKNLTCEKCTFQVAGECRRFPPSCNEYDSTFYPSVKFEDKLSPYFLTACAEYAEEGQVSDVTLKTVRAVLDTEFKTIWGKVE